MPGSKKSNSGDPTYDAISNYLMQRNSGKNFVKRALNPMEYPVIHNQDGTVSTHKMAWAENENGPVVYPTIIQDGTQLVPLEGKQAYDHAMSSGEFIPMPNAKMADYFSEQGYKKTGGWLTKYKDGGKVKPIYVDSKSDPRYRAYQDSAIIFNKQSDILNLNERQYNNTGKFFTKDQLREEYRKKGLANMEGQWVRRPVQPVIYQRPDIQMQPIQMSGNQPYRPMYDQMPVPISIEPDWKARYNRKTNELDMYNPKGHVEDTKNYSYKNGGKVNSTSKSGSYQTPSWLNSYADINKNKADNAGTKKTYIPDADFLSPEETKAYEAEEFRRKQPVFRQATPEQMNGQSVGSKTWEVLTNPMTAAKYAINKKPIPDHFSQLGDRNAYDMAMDIVNPFGVAENVRYIPGDIKDGNYGSALLRTVSVLPAAAELRGVAKQKAWLKNYQTPTVKQANIVRATDDMQRMYTQPEFKTRLGNYYDNLDGAMIRNNAENIPENIQLQHSTKNLVKGKWAEYNPNTNTINMEKYAPIDAYTTSVHEITHGIDGQFLNDKVQNALLKPFNKTKAEYDDAVDAWIKKNKPEGIQSNTELPRELYLSDPKEVHARMNQLRMWNNPADPWASITIKDLNKMNKKNAPGVEMLRLTDKKKGKEWVDLFNKMFTVAPVALGAAAVTDDQ